MLQKEFDLGSIISNICIEHILQLPDVNCRN